MAANSPKSRKRARQMGPEPERTMAIVMMMVIAMLVVTVMMVMTEVSLYSGVLILQEIWLG